MKEYIVANHAEMDIVADRTAGGMGDGGQRGSTCSQPVNRQPTFFQNRPRPIFVTVSGILLLPFRN